jgi:hypothetical protein
VRGLDGFAQQIGGVRDHVHLLVGLKATHRLADFMRELILIPSFLLNGYLAEVAR